MEPGIFLLLNASTNNFVLFPPFKKKGATRGNKKCHLKLLFPSQWEQYTTGYLISHPWLSQFPSLSRPVPAAHGALTARALSAFPPRCTAAETLPQMSRLQAISPQHPPCSIFTDISLCDWTTKGGKTLHQVIPTFHHLSFPATFSLSSEQQSLLLPFYPFSWSSISLSFLKLSPQNLLYQFCPSAPASLPPTLPHFVHLF